MVLPANLSVLLGALREQQQLRGSYFARKLVIFDLVIFEGWMPQETRETRSRTQSPTQPHRIGLHGPVCNSKYAAGSPPRLLFSCKWAYGLAFNCLAFTSLHGAVPAV